MKRLIFLSKLWLMLVISLWIGPFAKAEQKHFAEQELLVLILSSKQPPDFDSPWQKGRLQKEIYLGVSLAGGKILTTASAVKYSRFLEGRAAGQIKTASLQVIFVDEEINLALLKRENEDVKRETHVANLEKTLTDEKEAFVFKIQDELSFVGQKANLLKMGMVSPPNSYYSVGSYFLEKPSSEEQFSGPVFSKGKLTGFLIGQGGSLLFAIPATTISRFLQDAAHPKQYRGFPGLGMLLKPLRDPDLRNFISSSKQGQLSQTGLRVHQVFAGSPFASLVHPNDILLKVQGVQISAGGDYQEGSKGNIPFGYLLNQLHGGQSIQIQVQRQGKRLSFRAALPRHRSDQYIVPVLSEDYLLVGGLLFQELSLSYLQAFGENWLGAAPLVFAHSYLYQNEPLYPSASLSSEKGQQVVILNRILADEQNQGYEQQDVWIDKVNGQEVHSLEDVKQALLQFPYIQEGKRFAVFESNPQRKILILSYETLSGSHQRIAKKYKIPSTASFFSPPVL